MAEVYNNDASTSLAAACGAGDTSISVVSSTQFNTSGTFRIRIDDEILTVTGVAGTTWTVTRASEVCEGVQTAVGHSVNAAIYGVLTAASIVAGFSGGTGTVTTVSVATANGISGTVANPTTTPAITLSLASITPTTVSASGNVSSGGNIVATGTVLGSNLSGINTGDSGTVTTVSVVTANGVSGTVATATTTPAITLSLAAITPTSVAASGNVSGSNLSGTNTGDQTITLTGDVTGSGVGSFAATVAGHAVSYAKVQQASAATLLGNPTGGVANVAEITLGSGVSFSGSTLTATGSGGTVTSVAVAVPVGFTVSGSPVTTSGTITIGLSNETANTVWAGPASGLATTPTFRSLVAADVPALSYVTSVALTAPAIFSVSGSPITSAGTLAITLATETANTVWAGPASGAAVTPTFRALATADMPAGTGTVLSVGLSLPVQFTVTGSPVTTTGTLTATLAAPMILANGSQAFTADQSLGSHKLTNVTDPASAQDAATKNYVDTQIALLTVKKECQAASTATLAASTYANGASGVGATLTLTVAAVLVLDGYTPAINDRLLIKNQTDPTENGIYTLTTVGTIVVNAVLTRSLDFDQPADGVNGAFVFIQNGTVNAKTGWLCSSFGTITFGHGGTTINFVQDTGSGTYTGTTPISVNASNQISVSTGTTSSTVCIGNDSRLSDARTPVGTSLTSANLWVGSAGGVAAAVAVTGDITITNAGVTSVGTNKVTYAQMQQASAVTLIGNATAGVANVGEVTLGTGLSFVGTVLTGHAGTVTSVGVSGGTTGLTTSGGPITSSGTITLAGTLAAASGGLGADTSGYTSGQIPVAQGAGVYSADSRRGLFTGAGVPSGALGYIGDYYIDLSVTPNDIYQKS